MRIMTQTDFNTIVINNPDITAQGFGIKEFEQTDFATERAKLHTLFNETNVCEYWLSLCARTKTIRKRVGNSCDIARVFEEWYRDDTYQPVVFPVGALLVAALHLGIKCEKTKGSTNFYMNISNKRKLDGRWLNEYVLSSALTSY
jgi:hypothetical protein